MVVLEEPRHGRSLTEVSVGAMLDTLTTRRVADARAFAKACRAHDEMRSLGLVLTALVAPHAGHHLLALPAGPPLQRCTSTSHGAPCPRGTPTSSTRTAP